MCSHILKEIISNLIYFSKLFLILYSLLSLKSMMTDWLYFTVATTVTECAFEKQLQISNISVKPIYILKMTKHSGSRDVTFHQFSVEPKLSGF